MPVTVVHSIAALLRAAYGHDRSVTIWIAKIPIATNGRGGQLCGSGAIHGERLRSVMQIGRARCAASSLVQVIGAGHDPPGDLAGSGAGGVAGAVSWGWARAWRLRPSAVRNWRR